MEKGLNRRTSIIDTICLSPVFLFVLSILLIHLHLFSMPLTNVYWSPATDTSTLSDLFGYWKAIAIIGAACLSVVITAIAYFKGAISFKKGFFYIPALIYAVFVLISLGLSDYKYFALRGMSEHFEGSIVLLAYIMMLFFLVNVIDSEKRLKCIVFCVFSVAFLLGILGITQAIGHDFLATTVGQKIMIPNYVLDTGIKSWDMIDILADTGQRMFSFSFTDGEVYQTVYNINYVPFYLSLLIPISAALFVFMSKCKRKTKTILSCIFLILYGLFLYNFFAANSASGYIGLAVVFIVLLLVFRKYLKSWAKQIVCLIIVLGLVMSLLVDRWLPEIKSIVGDVVKCVTELVYADDATNSQVEFVHSPASLWVPINRVETYNDHVYFEINGNVLLITRDNDNASFVITDGAGEQLYLTKIEGEEGEFQFLDERFHDYAKVWLEKEGEYFYVVIRTRALTWRFCYTGDTFIYTNAFGKNVELNKIPHAGVFSNYYWGSSRGRIWDTTIPLLSHYLVSGAGADCYTFAFPQNDYVTLYNMQIADIQSLVTDKAHNLYLQYWVNTGLISLLAWLAMVGFYLVGAAKQFRKRGFVDFCDFVNGGIFCGICGFLAVAFFNDGSVNTMPMFYTMLGTGLAINMRDKWPGEETSTGSAAGDGPSTGSGPVEGKKGKKAAEVMVEM